MKTLNENFNRILSLLDELKEIQGRTKFQKIVYILKNKGIPFKEKFKFHYYGPFSPDLQLEIEELVDRGIIIEKNANPYTYELNNNAKVYFEKEHSIENNRDLLIFLNYQNYQKLELVSTMFFIQNHLSNNEEIIKKKVAALKPYLIKLIDESFELKKKIENM